MTHEPATEDLLAHLREHHGIDAVAATRLSVHKTYVFRIDRGDGEPWVARAFPPARPRAGVEGDAAILRFLERQGPLGHLHALSKVPPRERFERLRGRVRSADDGDGLPEALVHGNLLHAPDHAILGDDGPVAINWKASGRGPRLADLAYLLWGTGSWNPRRPNPENIDAAVGAYRRHVEPTDEELDRLEQVMYLRALYLVCFSYRRAVTAGVPFREWEFILPREFFADTATAARTALATRRRGRGG
jgi:Ser/Thr protein kinase RdoA (MazF antagonist)